MPKTPPYSMEFRREAVRLLRSSGRPIPQLAVELGVSPEQAEQHAYEASAAAAAARDAAIAERASFITGTVFSHPSKVDLIEHGTRAGYLVELHVMIVPEDLAVARVAHRMALGGHTVPEDKIRQRYRRLWALVARAREIVHRATFYDNTRSKPFAIVAVYERGVPVRAPVWPAWTPKELSTTT